MSVTYQQMTIFDVLESVEPAVPRPKQAAPAFKPGDYLEDFGRMPGATICHIMRPGYIGKLVCYDCSTQSHKWTRVGILEKYIPHEDTYRSVIYIGTEQRVLCDHRNGRSIYEVYHRRWSNEKRTWEFE